MGKPFYQSMTISLDALCKIGSWRGYTTPTDPRSGAPGKVARGGHKTNTSARLIVQERPARTSVLPMPLDPEGLTIQRFEDQNGRTESTEHFVPDYNPLERIMKEIRRRTKVVEAFPDGQSCLNLAAVRLRHIVGSKWSIRKYMNIAPVYAEQISTNGAAA